MAENYSESKFDDYGIYVIDQNKEFLFPNVEIKIEKISPNVFSYNRKDSENNLVEKMIPTKEEQLILEFTPIRPVNYPARRTNYVYLDFETPVFLSEGSAAKIFVRCPIEIGVFLIHDERKDSLDWFTCDPFNSRFGLYGNPESGTLCKYAKSDIVESYDDSIPFFNAVMEVNLKNNLDKGYLVSKIIFPISDNSVYYDHSKAIIDSLDVVLRKKVILEIIDVASKPIITDWKIAPTFEHITSIKRMDMGLE
ncbi:MAG: DUF432 domain-containing protein [Nitrosopumilus sp.]|uniref:DUF432 domain-containing protein n=1 Tax=Nitrosopumilus sp. TaxID=2024843 RepID=UPI00247D7013|nr:DUF432 domain-containing protein [Nitrosopumilus sp.]MCV0392405.1 DUF432 domain-containing protein [Nitrosopumilus sp.]